MSVSSNNALSKEYLDDVSIGTDTTETLTDVLIRSKEVGITKLLTICTTLDSFEKIKIIIEKDQMIYGTFGIHPHETENNFVTKETIIKCVKENNKIIGIGETGLDFFYNHSDKDKQIKSFKVHIEASIDLNIPIIIHSRDAEVETFKILNLYTLNLLPSHPALSIEVKSGNPSSI